MDYFDEEILEARMELERYQHTTLETGMYAGDELITFSRITLPGTKIYLYLPEQFIVMPDLVKDAKYPSKNAPDFVVTSKDGTVNFGFNILPDVLEEGETETMSSQFQRAICNINPSVRIKNQTGENKTEHGNEMSWFDFKGYTLDGQNYNRMYIIRMRDTVLHGIFNCPMQYKDAWSEIAGQCFRSVEEEI